MIEIHTLGRTRIAVNGQPLTGEAAWPRSMALIVYMAREPGPDRRQEILGVLWPDREERRARRALNQLLYTLRKASPELDLESVSDALDFGKEVWLDVEEFERRLDEGDLERAVELYEGPFLADLTLDEPEFDHWADRQRAEARRKFRKAALQLASDARERGDAEEAVGYCRRLVRSDPLDDEAQHLLIECLHQLGDRAAALRHYESYRELLARELDVEPLDHTLELVARIRGEAPAEDVEPEPIERPSAAVPAADIEPEPEAGPSPEVADDVTDTGSEEERPKAGPAVAAPRGDRRHDLISRSALVIGGLVLGFLLGVWTRPDAGPGDRTLAASGSGSGDALAVLPFETHGLGSDVDRLGEGIAQLLALDLARSGGDGEIVPQRAVQQVWASERLDHDSILAPARLARLASGLGAARLVVGDVHAAGDELRIVAQLVAVENGSELASADVRGSRAQLFELVERCARALSIRDSETVE